MLLLSYMKNINSIEKIVSLTLAEYGSGKNLEDYKLLLQDSGVSKDDAIGFFRYPEDQLFAIGINAYALREKLRDEDFLINFANNLIDIMDSSGKQELVSTMGNDGYFLNENEQFYKDKVVFKLHYNLVDHLVRVNDLIVSNPDFSGENDNVIDYLFNHPNEEVKIENGAMICEEEAMILLKKTPSKIINQLGFKNLASNIFFPGASRKMMQLRNPITVGELRKRGYSENLTLNDLFPEKFKGNDDMQGQAMTN